MGNKSKKTLEREAQRKKKKKSMDPKQIRARARRKGKVLDEELDLLYNKPVAEWDMEELARGRPRSADGTFRGPTPAYMKRSLHEEVVRRFEEVVKEEMSVHTVDALKVLGEILDDNEVDSRGRPMVSAGTKVDIAKFLIEHVVGKPTQRQEVDISVKLQGILANAAVTVDEGEFVPGLPGSVIDADSWEDDEDD